MFISESLLCFEITLIETQEENVYPEEVDPYKVNEDIVEYPYFAHEYEGTKRFWKAAMKYEGTRRLKELFEIKHWDPKDHFKEFMAAPHSN